MTPTPASYYVHGVELVNCGEDRCAACDRKMVAGNVADRTKDDRLGMEGGQARDVRRGARQGV